MRVGAGDWAGAGGGFVFEMRVMDFRNARMGEGFGGGAVVGGVGVRVWRVGCAEEWVDGFRLGGEM